MSATAASSGGTRLPAIYVARVPAAATTLWISPAPATTFVRHPGSRGRISFGLWYSCAGRHLRRLWVTAAATALGLPRWLPPSWFKWKSCGIFPPPPRRGESSAGSSGLGGHLGEGWDPPQLPRRALADKSERPAFSGGSFVDPPRPSRGRPRASPSGSPWPPLVRESRAAGQTCHLGSGGRACFGTLALAAVYVVWVPGAVTASELLHRPSSRSSGFLWPQLLWDSRAGGWRGDINFTLGLGHQDLPVGRKSNCTNVSAVPPLSSAADLQQPLSRPVPQSD